MWMSKRIAMSGKRQLTAELGQVSSLETGLVSVQSGHEYRDVPMMGPSGIAYMPVEGARSVILSANGTPICAGVIGENKALEAGELMLYSAGGASIVLKNDGSVLINGTPFPSGGGA